jgi:hypothetical protein
MSKYYYYSKVLAQLSAIFYCAGCPRDNNTISDIMYNCEHASHNHYNKNYNLDFDALDAYNDYIPRNKAKSFKEIFTHQLKRNFI